ncbi:hypothetical protein BGZ76_007022 [Entomortierella beljakovae]|nr:hypothetical protein BGZ76_007022 [Entomortierella beljakovae]
MTYKPGSGVDIPRELDFIQLGDQARDNGDFDEAAKCYNQAKNHSPDVAEKRLNELPYQQLSVGGRLLGELSDGWSSRVASAKKTIAKLSRRSSRDFSIKGSFFKNVHSQKKIDMGSDKPMALQFAEKEEFSFEAGEITTTKSLVAAFVKSEGEKRIETRRKVQDVILQFKDSFLCLDTVHELVILATIPDRELFLAILEQMLQVLKNNILLSNVTVQGLAVMLISCPDEIDLSSIQDVFFKIFTTIRSCLDDVRSDGGNEILLVPLLRALSALFDAMICRKVLSVDRNLEYLPLKATLDGLSSHDDPTVAFLAQYARQGLITIGDNESVTSSIIRRGQLAFAIVGSIGEMTGSYDITKFFSVYEAFSEICDFSKQASWYQGLMYLNCVIGSEDWTRMESFILKSKLKSDKYFLQGVCLCLEQIVTTHDNEDVQVAAISLLYALKASWSRRVHKLAKEVLNRLGVYHEEGFLSRFKFHHHAHDNQQSHKDDILQVCDPLWYSNPSDILLKAMLIKERQETIILSLPSQLNNISVLIQTGHEHVVDSLQIGVTAITSDIGQLRTDISKITEKPQKSVVDINTALDDYYKPFMSIQRISGDEMDIGSCYINLAVVETPDEHTIGNTDSMETFHRLPNYEDNVNSNTLSVLTIENIFNKRKLKNGQEGIPKKTLIHGRAGIGKSTLCKKILHLYQNGMWRDQFNAVLWIPLRQLRAYHARNIEDLLSEKFFSQYPKQDREAFVRTMTDDSFQDNVLFILDGLDEIVLDAKQEVGLALEGFLRKLLQNEYVIVTSRPSGIDAKLLPTLDQELETIGFSTRDVSNYISKALDPEEAEEVQAFIQQTPLIQSLVNIPVQLDVICFSWDTLPKDPSAITMTKLYQSMVYKLWKKDACKLRKSSTKGKELTKEQIDRLLPSQVDRLISIEMEYLAYLAFKGMKEQHQIEFDEPTLSQAMEELDGFRANANPDSEDTSLPETLIDDLKETSFLHTMDADVDYKKSGSHHKWYFLHLTFQEYYASMWIARHLNIRHLKSSNKLAVSMSVDETTEFMKQNKYNPRYEIVWWMVAGQLKGAVLESFFDLLQQAPRDLIGARHRVLLTGCYKEGRTQLLSHAAYKANEIENELLEWKHFEMTMNGESIDESIIGWEGVIHKEVLRRAIDKSKMHYPFPPLQEEATSKGTSWFRKALSATEAVSSSACRAAHGVGSLESSIVYVVDSVTEAITDSNATGSIVTESPLSDLSYTNIVSLLEPLGCPESRTRLLAAQGIVCEFKDSLAGKSLVGDNLEVLKLAEIALTSALTDPTSDIRCLVAEALGYLPIISEAAILALVSAL